MKQRPRIYYSAEQKNLMWDRWPAGDSLYEFARLFDRGHSSVQGVLAETGGDTSTGTSFGMADPLPIDRLLIWKPGSLPVVQRQ